MALTQIKTDAISDDAVTLAKQAAGTDGQIITYDASGNPTAVGPGTDGQVLTSTGAGSPPAFEAIPAGVGGATGVDFDDNAKIRLGTGNDTHLYHNGSHTYISHRGTGSLILEPKEGENGITLEADGAAKLYYDNTERVATSANGVALAGQIDIADGSGSDGGNHIRIGNSFDCRIYHDGTDTYINNRTGKLRILSDDLRLENTAGDETLAKFANGGASELRYNDSAKLTTIDTGVNITGGVRLGGNNADNELDDYEEGTFTPTWNNVTNASTHAVWNYIKVGKLVHVSGWFKCNTTTNSGSDGVSASGLPFTTAANPTNGYIGFVGNIVYENINAYSSGNFATLLTDNSSTFYPYKCQQNGGWENLRSDDVSANDYMIISFCYRI